MSADKRYAIITPYWNEDRALLERCIKSVRGQTVAADHLLVADGLPQAWIDREPVRHFKLDRTHGDYGKTPRGIGALIAVAEGYDAIGFLDADNWFENDHVESCLDAARGDAEGYDQCDYVVARRLFRRPDESIMPLGEEPGHVDTNCFFLLRGSFYCVANWATMPKELSVISDRVFRDVLKSRGLRFASVQKRTVNYHCMWQSLYDALKETPPEGAKPNVSTRAIGPWLRTLPPRELEIVRRLAGIRLGAPEQQNQDAGPEE